MPDCQISAPSSAQFRMVIVTFPMIASGLSVTKQRCTQRAQRFASKRLSKTFLETSQSAHQLQLSRRRRQFPP